jgi:hypothetical protein
VCVPLSTNIAGGCKCAAGYQAVPSATDPDTFAFTCQDCVAGGVRRLCLCFRHCKRTHGYSLLRCGVCVSPTFVPPTASRVSRQQRVRELWCDHRWFGYHSTRLRVSRRTSAGYIHLPSSSSSSLFFFFFPLILRSASPTPNQTVEKDNAGGYLTTGKVCVACPTGTQVLAPNYYTCARCPDSLMTMSTAGVCSCPSTHTIDPSSTYCILNSYLSALNLVAPPSYVLCCVVLCCVVLCCVVLCCVVLCCVALATLSPPPHRFVVGVLTCSLGLTCHQSTPHHTTPPTDWLHL